MSVMQSLGEKISSRNEIILKVVKEMNEGIDLLENSATQNSEIRKEKRNLFECLHGYQKFCALNPAQS